MPRTQSACSGTSRRLPNWLALQRGRAPGSREDRVTRRFIQGPPDDDTPCARAGDMVQRGQRTRCYDIKDQGLHVRRKTCRILAMDGHNLFPPGFYLYGARNFNGPRAQTLLCNRGHSSRDEAPPTYSVCVLGPFWMEPRQETVVLCTAAETLLAGVNHESTDFAHKFSMLLRQTINIRGQSVSQQQKSYQFSFVPTLEMLRGFEQSLQGVHDDTVRQLRTFAQQVRSQLEPRYRKMESLKALCDRDPSVKRRVRAILRAAFEFGMYSRRWCGPGTRYPVDIDATRRKCGTQHKAISPRLVGKFAVAGRGGVRLVARDRGNSPADAVNSEGRMTNMELMLRLAIHTIVEQEGEKIEMLACMDTVGTVDGGYWPSDVTLLELLESCEGGLSQERQGGCVRTYSTHIINSCLMLLPMAYVTTPAWAKIDGLVIPIVEH